jgi:hypothetical protein
VSLHVTAVAAAVAALDIPGVAIQDVNEMAQGLTGRTLPLLTPGVAEGPFLSDWEPRRISLEGNYQNSYTLNYTLYYAPAGKDRGLFALYPGMVAAVEKVINAFQRLTHVTGCKSITLERIPQMGQIRDVSDQKYHGAVLSLRVIEF